MSEPVVASCSSPGCSERASAPTDAALANQLEAAGWWAAKLAVRKLSPSAKAPRTIYLCPHCRAKPEKEPPPIE